MLRAAFYFKRSVISYLEKVQLNDKNLECFVKKYHAAYLNKQISYEDKKKIKKLFLEKKIDILITTLLICFELDFKANHVLVKSNKYFNAWSYSNVEYQSIHYHYISKIFMFDNTDNKLILFNGRDSDSESKIEHFEKSLKSNLLKNFYTHYLECEYIADRFVKDGLNNLTQSLFYDKSFLNKLGIKFSSNIEVNQLTKEFVCRRMISLNTANNLANLLTNDLNFKEYVIKFSIGYFLIFNYLLFNL